MVNGQHMSDLVCQPSKWGGQPSKWVGQSSKCVGPTHFPTSVISPKKQDSFKKQTHLHELKKKKT